MALEQAYDQRPLLVAPSTRSPSSRNGSCSLLPYTSLVDATRIGRFFLFASVSITSVRWTLVSMVRTGDSTISFTPTAAAR